MSRTTRSRSIQAAAPDVPVPPPQDPPIPAPPASDLIPPDQYVGQPLLLPKPPEWTRIYVQNPNGLSIGAAGDISTALEELRNAEADVMMFPETNLAMDQPFFVKNQVHHECKKAIGMGRYRFVASQSNVSYSTFYKPGGVLGVAVGPVSGRLLAVGADDYGRWIHITFSGRGNRVITLICTYQVCHKTAIGCGPLTATTQQYSMLLQQNKPNPHNVRKHHAKDLLAFVKIQQRAGALVAVMGDFNDTIGDERQHRADQDLQLLDKH